MTFNVLSLSGLQRFKNHLSSVLTSKVLDDTVTGQYTFQSKPLFNLDTKAIDDAVLPPGNLIFFDVNDDSQIGSLYLKNTDNLYFDIDTAPPVDGYDFVSMEYDPQTEKYHLWYIPLTNPVVSSSSQMISYINQGIVPNTKNLTTIEFKDGNTRLNKDITEIPRFYSKNATRISFYDNWNSPVKIIHSFDTTNCRDSTGFQTESNISFYQCTELEEVPLVDTSNLTFLNYIFSGCSKIETIPSYDFSNANTLRAAFGYCTSLEEVPSLDTSKCTTFNIMFRDCTNLKKIYGLNFSRATSLGNMFLGCDSLEEIHIDFGNNSNSVLNTLFGDYVFGSNQMINLYVKNIPQSVRSAIQSNYSAHVTIIDE